MEVSILLMQQIAQLFIVLLMGYVVVKAGLLKASDSKVLSVVFVYLVMPCVVLNAFQIDDTPQIRNALRTDSHRTLVFDGHSGWNAYRVSGPQCHL